MNNSCRAPVSELLPTGTVRALMVAILACCAACTDVRSPIVWDGQTDRAERAVVSCLKNSTVFESISPIRVDAGGVAGVSSLNLDTRSYWLASDAALHFDKYKASVDRIFVRSRRELSEVEKSELSKCAPFPH